MTCKTIAISVGVLILSLFLFRNELLDVMTMLLNQINTLEGPVFLICFFLIYTIFTLLLIPNFLPYINAEYIFTEKNDCNQLGGVSMATLVVTLGSTGGAIAYFWLPEMFYRCRYQVLVKSTPS